MGSSAQQKKPPSANAKMPFWKKRGIIESKTLRARDELVPADADIIAYIYADLEGRAHARESVDRGYWSD